MSRCFPYPPPQYNGAEIESIKPELTIDLVALKLLKEQEKAKEKNRRKEKKREKKEKKAALRELENSERSKHELKKRNYEESTTKTTNSPAEQLERSGLCAEQLERSGLTEELELPYATQAADYSPERSQDSNKRRKLAPSPGRSRANNNGIILRIKLPTAKHAQRDAEPPAAAFPSASLIVPERAVAVKQREPELTRLQQQGGGFEPCVRMEQNGHRSNFGCKQDDSQPASIPPQSKESDQERQPACKEEEPCFSGRSGEEAVPPKSEHVRAPSRRRKLSRTEKEGRQFMDLIMNWSLPPPEQLEDSDHVDQEWLFAASARPSKADLENEGRVGKEERSLSCENGVASSLQPRACYLPELGVYQLPYVIPF